MTVENWQSVPVVLALALLFAAALMLWRHVSYTRMRREAAEDRQEALHERGVFHVITFFRVREGARVAESAALFCRRMSGAGSPRLIHAGRAAFTVNSEQLGARDWDGVVLLQYPDRAHYENAAAAEHRAANRECFSESYIHGMRRDRGASLAVPQVLLRTRIADLLQGRWRPAPLERVPDFETSPGYDHWRQRIARLRALNTVNPRALIVYNLIKHGTPEQRLADRSYNRQMMSRMAALTHGPLHIGRSTALEGSARFDDVVIVFYPGPAYYIDLLSSRFYQDIVGDKQLADTTAVPTAPITQQVEDAVAAVP